MRCVAIGSSADAGSSINSTSGFDGERPRDAQPLLLPAGERERRVVQPVLHFFPQRRRLQRSPPLASSVLPPGPVTRGPYATFSKIDLGNGFDF